MTSKQTESVKKLKLNEIIDIGQVRVRRDRGQYSITKDRFIKIYKDSEFTMMSEKIDELNTTISDEKITYSVPGTKLVVIKTPAGNEVYQAGKLVQESLSESDLDTYISHHKRALENKKVEKIKKELVSEHKVSRQKKVLYYFILFLSTVLLVMTYVLGVKFDGVRIKRDNNNLYQTIVAISEAKHPGKKTDKFDEVYYTLNYYAHQQDYFMIEKDLDGTVVRVNSWLYVQNSKLGDTVVLSKKDDLSYSGSEFNAYFKDSEGRQLRAEEIYRRIGYILGETEIRDLEHLLQTYLIWDNNDIKSNKAYNWEAIDFERREKPIDIMTDYYSGYLTRNGFIKLFLNHPSKFIHEYNMFESLGWLNWTSIVVFALYLILAACIWIFKKDNLKISKGLIITIMITTAIVFVPLILQYMFEGLSKDATEFLDIVENTRFTTTTTLMNFIFDYLVKFSNFILTGVLTIALPLKVVRYFVLNAVKKLDKEKKITTILDSNTSLSRDVKNVNWRLE